MGVNEMEENELKSEEQEYRDLEREADVVRKRNLANLEEDSKEIIKSIKDNFFPEVQLDTYLQHYRYVLYVYFRYGVDLIYQVLSRKTRSIITEWGYMLGNIVENKQADDQHRQYVTVYSKLVYGNGRDKEIIAELPPIMPLRKHDSKFKVSGGRLSNIVTDARNNSTIHPDGFKKTLSESYGGDWIGAVAGDYASGEVRKACALDWVKTIETIDSWIKEKLPNIGNKLAPLPTIEEVRDLLGVDSQGNKIKPDFMEARLEARKKSMTEDKPEVKTEQKPKSKFSKPIR